jgi:multiple sugar transport system permease protein
VVRKGVKPLIFVLFAVFFALPIIWLVLATTKNGDKLHTGAPLSFGSIHQLVRNWHQLHGFLGDAYAGWFGNTAKYTLTAGAILIAVDIPAGYGLAVGGAHLRRVVLTSTLVVMLIPSFALVLPVFLEINDAHLIGNSLSLILPFSFFPFGVYLSYLYFSTTKTRDLFSAARVDGCSEFQVFMRIAVPLSKPAIALVAFFSFVANWNNFFLPLAILPNSTEYPLQLGLILLPRGSPVLALGVLISILPVFLLFLFCQRYLLAGLTSGSTTD